MEYLVASAIIVVANAFGDHPGGPRWEIITALFGWMACVAIIFYTLLQLLALAGVPAAPEWVFETVFEIGLFSLLTALSRDYEYLLKPLADRFFPR